MARELFIDQYANLPRSVDNNAITTDICNYFANKKIDYIEYLIPAFVSDKYDVEKYTRICQYLDAFIFKYGKLTPAHFIAIVFLQLDSNKNGLLNDSEVKVKLLSNLKKKKLNWMKNIFLLMFFMSLFESINSVILDKETILQCVKDWSFYDLVTKHSKHSNFLTDGEVFNALTDYFQLKSHPTPLHVLIRLYATSKVHKFSIAEFHELLMQMKFVQQKVGMNIFSINVVSFRILDVSNNGFLTLTNFSRFMQKAGFDTKKSKVKEFIKKLDANGDGVLQIDEFIVVTENLSSSNVPTSFLDNLNAKSQSDIKNDTNETSSVRKSLRLSVKEQKKSGLVRTPLKIQEYTDLFKELTTKSDIDINAFQVAIEKVIGEKNAHTVRGASHVLFNVANLNCDSHLDVDEFSIVCDAMKKCLKVDVVTETDLYKTFFNCIDGNHDGLVNAKEMQFLIQQIDGETLSDTETNNLIRTFDEDYKGQLNINEFLCYFMQLDDVKLDDPEDIKEAKVKRQIQKTFRLIDIDNSNSIEFDEILAYVINTIGQISKEDKICLGAMFYICDTNHNESMDMDEFLQFYFLFEYYVDEDGTFDRISIYAELFEMLDTERVGKLKRSQLAWVLTKVEWDETIDSFMEKYDLNKNDEVELNEFILGFCGKDIDEDDV
ncbi:EF-hand domain-containing protein [Entamoeba marina]